MIARTPLLALTVGATLLGPAAALAQAIEISPEWRVKTTQRVRPPARSSYIPSSDLAPQAPPEAVVTAAAQPAAQPAARPEPAPTPIAPVAQPLAVRREPEATPVVTAGRAESAGGGRLDFLFRN